MNRIIVTALVLLSIWAFALDTAYAESERPPGWDKGKKEGFEDGLPPGQAKKAGQDKGNRDQGPKGSAQKDGGDQGPRAGSQGGHGNSGKGHKGKGTDGAKDHGGNGDETSEGRPDRDGKPIPWIHDPKGDRDGKGKDGQDTPDKNPKDEADEKGKPDNGPKDEKGDKGKSDTGKAKGKGKRR